MKFGVEALGRGRVSLGMEEKLLEIFSEKHILRVPSPRASG